MPEVSPLIHSPLGEETWSGTTRDYKEGIINGAIISAMGGCMLGFSLGISIEDKLTRDNLAPTCEAVGSMDTPGESLANEINDLRALCTKYGFIQ